MIEPSRLSHSLPVQPQYGSRRAGEHVLDHKKNANRAILSTEPRLIPYPAFLYLLDATWDTMLPRRRSSAPFLSSNVMSPNSQ